MRTVVVTKGGMDYSRAVETFTENLRRQTGHEIEVLDPESREGESFCRAYDIVEYPTVIAIASDGRVQNSWPGAMLPTISEVSYYVSQS